LDPCINSAHLIAFMILKVRLLWHLMWRVKLLPGHTFLENMDSHGTSPFSPSKEVLQQSDYTFQVSYSLIFPALPIQRSGLNRTSAEIHLWHTGAKAYNCVSSCRILELLRESSSRLGMDKANVYSIPDLKVARFTLFY
jgi:hypothetical protein